MWDSYPPKVNVSGTDVRPKEVVLVVLALLVLVLSLCLFFKKVFWPGKAVMQFKSFRNYPPVRKASRELANFIKRKTHPP